jgi:hypothetical protein
MGSPGNYEFVIGFYEVPHFNNGPRVTFEVILHEDNNAIELQYGEAPTDGGIHSVGIENVDGTIGLQIAYGNSIEFFNQGFLIKPPTIVEKTIVNGPDLLNCPTYTTPESLVFEVLDSSCSDGIGDLEEFEFFLNGTSLGTLSADSTYSCDCSAPVLTYSVTDSSLLASLWNVGGDNTVRFVKPGYDESKDPDFLGWVRVDVTYVVGCSHDVCIVDISGGDCSEYDLCAADYTEYAVDHSTNVTTDGVIDKVVEVGKNTTTSYDFSISHSNPDFLPILILDTVPAEWIVTAVAGNPVTAGFGDGPDGFGGIVDVYSANKKADNKSATKIAWLPDPESYSSEIFVSSETRQSPGKNNVKYAPTSCGALYLNDGAKMYQIDSETDEPLMDANGDWLPPIAESEPLCLAAVKDVNKDGMIMKDGSGDEDGDTLEDFYEACVIGTDPCMYDTDGDGIGDADDCEPLDSTIYPGAEEIYCNGVDEDCDGLDAGAFEGTGQCYILAQLAEPVVFDVAEQACIDLYGGHLASIHSQEEDDFISNLVDPAAAGSITAYIGYTDKAIEDTWVWTDGTPSDFTNWRLFTGEPNNSGGDEDCTQFWPNTNGALSGWNDVPCSLPFTYFVCKWDLL